MNFKMIFSGCLLALVVVFLNFQAALAHESITAGDYEIEVGWVTEPPIAGQQNGIVINVSNMSSGEAQPVEDVSVLTVTVSYGGQSKTLTLQPLGEETPGQFVSLIIPTVPGEYEIVFGGSLGETAVDAHTHVEEVQSAATLQFPVVSASQPDSGSAWLVWLSLLMGLIGVGLSVTALRNKVG